MRRYRVVMLGYAISSYGTYLNTIALNLFVYVTTRSALLTGVVMAVRLLSGVLAGMVSNRISERFTVRTVMAVSNICQGLALVPVIMAPRGAAAAALLACALIIGFFGTLFVVSLRAGIPEIVGSDHREGANSLMVTARSTSMVLGFASAGLIIQHYGFRAGFVIDMASFFVCAATVLALPRISTAGAASGERTERKSAWGVVTSGVAPLLGFLVVIRGVDALGSASHNVGLPVYSARLHGNDPAAFVSQFWLVWSIGCIAAQIGLTWARKRGMSVGARGFAGGTIAMSSFFILGFCGFPMAVTLAAAFCAGLADGVTVVAYVSHLQTLPAAVRTQVFGASATVENIGFGGGMVVVAALLDHFSPLTVVASAHGAAIVGAVVLFVLLARHGSKGAAEVHSIATGVSS